MTYANELTSSSLEENLKKALTELLVLQLLSEREYYAGELTYTLHNRSNNILSVAFPYSALYRMIENGYISEVKKRIAPDGRRRQYYQITPEGIKHLNVLINTYRTFIKGVEAILNYNCSTSDE